MEGEIINRVNNTGSPFGGCPLKPNMMREYMTDTSLRDIRRQANIKVEGLYYIDYNGEHQVPTNIYFGIDWLRPDGIQLMGGEAYMHINNALYPVFDKDGYRYRVPELRNVCAEYDGNTISHFYRE